MESGRPHREPSRSGRTAALGVTLSDYRSLTVRDCLGTLLAFLRKYKGSARASFEGDLHELRLDQLPGASIKESGALQRQTITPELDFVIVPVTSATLIELEQRMALPAVLGADGSVLHVQVEVDGDLHFSACDNFHPDATVVSHEVPEGWLQQLQSAGLFEVAEARR